MMDEVLPLIAAAACVMVLMLTAILLVRRRMRRGEIVQATVRRVDLDDADPKSPTSVTLTYAFPWQGQTLEICQPPRQGILPPQEGERQEMRWDPISRRLRELPSGRSAVMPILIYVFVLSTLTVAAGFAAVALPSVPPAWYVLTSVWGVIGFLAAVFWMTLRQIRAFGKQVESGILRPVRAEFQGYVHRTDTDGDSINVPVYRCFWSGRTYRLEIGGGKRPYRPGETVTLYRDQRNGSVVEAPKRYRSTRQTL